MKLAFKNHKSSALFTLNSKWVVREGQPFSILSIGDADQIMLDLRKWADITFSRILSMGD